MVIPVDSSTNSQVSRALNCIGRHSREEEFLFWQILEPPGIISLQIDLEGEVSQSVLLEQVAKISRFSKIIKVKILPGIEHLSSDEQNSKSLQEHPESEGS